MKVDNKVQERKGSEWVSHATAFRYSWASASLGGNKNAYIKTKRRGVGCAIHPLQQIIYSKCQTMLALNFSGWHFKEKTKEIMQRKIGRNVSFTCARYTRISLVVNLFWKSRHKVTGKRNSQESLDIIHCFSIETTLSPILYYSNRKITKKKKGIQKLKSEN